MKIEPESSFFLSPGHRVETQPQCMDLESRSEDSFHCGNKNTGVDLNLRVICTCVKQRPKTPARRMCDVPNCEQLKAEFSQTSRCQTKHAPGLRMQASYMLISHIGRGSWHAGHPQIGDESRGKCATGRSDGRSSPHGPLARQPGAAEISISDFFPASAIAEISSFFCRHPQSMVY